MSVERTTVRRSRKDRPCTGYRCGRMIRRGDLYNEHVTGPGHDILCNERWLVMAECATCAAEYGHPIPGTRTAE